MGNTPKFKVGDMVVCVPHNGRESSSAGWKPGKVFKIHSIRSTRDSGDCYFPDEDSGVYGNCLKLLNEKEWD